MVLVAAGLFAACSSDSNTPATTDSGVKSTCGNNKIEGSEDCDGTQMGSGTCASETSGMMTSGTLGCTNCTYDTGNCKVATATGGTTGSGGAGGTMGSGATMGSGGAKATGGSGGKATGGTTSKDGGGTDGGGEAGDSSTTPPTDAGKDAH
jgi:hypothetical protein